MDEAKPIKSVPADPKNARVEDPSGQIRGTPAGGEIDLNVSDNPSNSVGLNHWRESVITKPGLNDRGNVFFAAIEMTRMPMILTDPNQPDNPIAFANKAFLDLTGYEEQEILGRNCRFLQGAMTDRGTVDQLRDAVSVNNSIAAEILNYKRDGTPFWNAVFIGPVHDTDGKVLYHFASQLDVTRRRDSEQAFRQAQKMEAIGQLTAGLAHDFNNLLQVVNGNLELLGTQIESGRAQRYLGNARAAADRGAKLTRQLLAFARKTRLTPRPIDLSELIGEFVEVIESSVGQQAHLRLNLRRRLPLVMVDPEQLEMALLNVVINARDALPRGGTITLATRTRETPEGEQVILEVQDEGEGMSPDVIERATEPFFTTKRDGKGTGLGLAMASGFVQQSRGTMEIDSTVGKGTTVRLAFPIAERTAEPHEAEQPTAAAQPPNAERQGSVAHILAVEDSSEVLELAVEILCAAGYRVTTAENGDIASQMFKDAPVGTFDLLFTDLVMPGSINGLLLAEEIHARDPSVGILMTTGYNEELVVSGPQRIARDVLGKPYRRGELLDRVRQALSRRGHSADVRRNASEYGAAEA